MMDVNFILEATNGKLLSGNGAATFSGVSTDTRKIDKDEIFFALKGDTFNGNVFAKSAVENGAKYCIVD